jgi:hypothetical protein
MVYVLKNLLLAFSCFPLVFGCCWQDYSSGGRPLDTPHQDDGWLVWVDFLPGQADCRDRMQHQGTDDQAPEHCCFRAVPSPSSILYGDASGGVQIGNSSALVDCSLVTRSEACNRPVAYLAGSIRPHLAKQVLLI